MRRLLSLTVLVAAFAAASADASASHGAERNDGRATLSSRSVSPHGRILTDSLGYTLYLFTKDQRRSECYGACREAWPPFLTEGRPRAGKGIDAGELGVTRRRGGRMQVTYDGHPLYYYVGEHRPLLVLCHDVFEFGGTWLVVDTQGRAKP